MYVVRDGGVVKWWSGHGCFCFLPFRYLFVFYICNYNWHLNTFIGFLVLLHVTNIFLCNLYVCIYWNVFLLLLLYQKLSPKPSVLLKPLRVNKFFSIPSKSNISFTSVPPPPRYNTYIFIFVLYDKTHFKLWWLRS